MKRVPVSVSVKCYGEPTMAEVCWMVETTLKAEPDYFEQVTVRPPSVLALELLEAGRAALAAFEEIPGSWTIKAEAVKLLEAAIAKAEGSPA